MRLFAEERGTGTLEVLMTSPLRDWEVVLTKYLACYIFYLLLWIPTLAFLPVLLDMGTPVIKPVGTFSSVLFTGGIGVILLSLVSFMFPLGRGGRLFGVFVLLAGVAGAVWGGWEHFRFFDKSHLVLISVEFDAIWVVLFLGGIGAIILSLLSFLLPLGTGGRLFGAFLLVVGIGCATGGGWSHFRFDDEHLISIPVGIDPMPVLSSYIGIALVGAMFLSLGLLVSSMVRSQLVAFLLSFALGLIFIVVGIWRPDLETNTPWHQFLYSFTVPLHFSRDFGRGLIDTRHLVVYGTVSLFCLFMTVRSLESRRWQ